MILLFDEDEQSFTSLGKGSLKDATSCVVTEKLNDTFELKLEYPIKGAHYSKIREEMLIFCKPNPYDNAQAFRISSISKAIKGIVTITAEHISYDANNIPVKAIDSTSMADALEKIQNDAFIPHNFKFFTNVTSAKTFKTYQAFNMRSLLMGEDESLVNTYKAEVKFDNYNINVLKLRGQDRGARVAYGVNMTDLKHESNNEKMYNGVMPYYHKEKTSTETVTENQFTKAYIVGPKAMQSGWLAYSAGGEPIIPVDTSPVQIATEGDYYEKVYTWNQVYEKYEERVYNETVTIVEGLIEPTWIRIDWSKFPVISCVANANGYFKSATDSDWGDIKGVGDVIFQGNIIKEGLSGMATNIMLSYSEVIPTNTSSETKEVSSVVDVTLYDDTKADVSLEDAIIWINTKDALAMKHNKILSLNLTNEFDEEPTREKLRARAEQYISEKGIGVMKHTTTVSFVDLARAGDTDTYQNFDHIELGDTVQVIYEDLGVDVKLRVIETEFDVLTETYNKIELGEKDESLSTQSIQNGDNISSLTNDADYADVTRVNKLIADTVTAEMIQAANAKLSKAQIEDLEVAKISCKGIFEASQFILDDLVAKMLTADNAKIKGVLEAGELKVAGDISVNSGSIRITSEDGTMFTVDREGNVTANSVTITGGTLNINDGVFEVMNNGHVTAKSMEITGGELDINNGVFHVSEDGTVTAKAGTIGGCQIDEQGNLIIPAANVDGEVKAKSLKVVNLSGNTVFEANAEAETIKIAGFDVDWKCIRSGGVESFSDTSHNGVYLGPDGLRLGPNFSVDNTGVVTARGLKIDLTETQKQELQEQAKPDIAIQNGVWYVNGESTNVQAVGKDGISPDAPTVAIDENGYWVIDGEKSTVKAEGSDANVTWDNIVAQFDTTSTTSKGLYYKDGALLLNANAGQIGGWTITEQGLGKGSIGSDGGLILFPTGAKGTVAGHYGTDWTITAGSSFGVTSNGTVYSNNLIASRGKIGPLTITNEELNYKSGNSYNFAIENNDSTWGGYVYARTAAFGFSALGAGYRRFIINDKGFHIKNFRNDGSSDEYDMYYDWSQFENLLTVYADTVYRGGGSESARKYPLKLVYGTVTIPKKAASSTLITLTGAFSKAVYAVFACSADHEGIYRNVGAVIYGSETNRQIQISQWDDYKESKVSYFVIGA